jgi:hypothetical protein
MSCYAQWGLEFSHGSFRGSETHTGQATGEGAGGSRRVGGGGAGGSTESTDTRLAKEGRGVSR